MPLTIPLLVRLYNGVAFALLLFALAYLIAYHILPPAPAGGTLP